VPTILSSACNGGHASLCPPYEAASLHAQGRNEAAAATKQPDGQITQNPVQPLSKKYFAYPVGQISALAPPVSPDERGGSRSSRTRGGMRWTRCQVRGKQNFSRMTVARKPGHRGERGVSRKPLRRESRIASAEPVCSCAFSFVHLAHETAGAARIRLSLHPLVHSEGGNRRKARAHRAARMRTHGKLAV
jgi:hypothetical protein